MKRATITSGPTSKFIDPLTDFGFKHLLGSEPNKEIMIAFLNAIFAGKKEIVDLVFSPTEHAGSTDEYKKVFFDLMCTGKDGSQFIIEMQRREQECFHDRCIYYLSRLISEQLPKGASNWDIEQLKEVYLIAILEFKFKNNDDDHYLHDIALMNKDTGKVFYDKLGFKFLELPNFGKEAHELKSDLDKWFYILKNMSQMEKIPAYLNKGIFEKLFKIAKVSKLTEEQRKIYESNLKAKRDYMATIAFARKEEGKKARELGREEGMEKGIELGRVEGREEGIELGREEGMELGRVEGRELGREEGIEFGRLKEKLATALELKESGMSVDQISKITKLSIEEIIKPKEI
jgi:predicted transposase/invertase (TIGR01784 family)